jgi:hypothetical protein
MRKKEGLNRDSNPRPPAPKAGIIPLDHWATYNAVRELKIYTHYKKRARNRWMFWKKINWNGKKRRVLQHRRSAVIWKLSPQILTNDLLHIFFIVPLAISPASIALSYGHGLINYTDTKAFVGLFSKKLTCRKISCIYLPSKQMKMYSFADRGRGGGGGGDARPA